MRKLIALLTLICLSVSIQAQVLTTLPPGGNKKASVSERIGITDVTITYNRPGVKGREGKIWGNVVQYGYNDLGFGTNRHAPWRAGANENTTISFSTDVMIEGKPLAAGTYGFHIDLEPGHANLLFNKVSNAWGSFFYDPKLDALTVDVKTENLNESVEWLKYEFMNQKENSAVIALIWEKLKIPFKVEVDYVQTQLASYRTELMSNKGFTAPAWMEAIDFSLDRKVNLDEAVQWSDYAINGTFVGQKTFRTLSTRARALNAVGRTAEADSFMKAALPLANMNELHNYGRQLLRDKKYAEALNAFKMNGEKYPNVFTTNMGLMRGYSANGDYKKALKYAQAALLQAPDPQNKTAIEGFVKMLKEGKDVN